MRYIRNLPCEISERGIFFPLEWNLMKKNRHNLSIGISKWLRNFAVNDILLFFGFFLQNVQAPRAMINYLHLTCFGFVC